jgi:hypothetical protein
MRILAVAFVALMATAFFILAFVQSTLTLTGWAPDRHDLVIISSGVYFWTYWQMWGLSH